jgi:hypothetical protein
MAMSALSSAIHKTRHYHVRPRAVCLSYSCDRSAITWSSFGLRPERIGSRVVKKLERQKNLQSLERRKLTGGA